MEKSKLTKALEGEESSKEHAHHFFYIQANVRKEFDLADQTVNMHITVTFAVIA
jgi:hypothetical protein